MDTNSANRIGTETMRMIMILSAIFDKYGEIQLTQEELEKAELEFGISCNGENGILSFKKVGNEHIINRYLREV